MSKIVRQLSIVAALLVLVGAVFFFRYLSSQKQPPKRKAAEQQQLREVEVINTTNQAISTELEVQGRLSAFNKIDIFAEVSGTLKDNAKAFKVGSRFTKDNVLLSIDDEEAHLSLLSQKSSLLNSITRLLPDLKIDYPESFEQWKTYIDHFDVKANIQPLPEPLNDQERYFIASKDLHSLYYNIRSAETRLTKYTIYAPFSGVITEASINPGSLVRSGQKLGELMNANQYELEATISLSDLKHIKIGNIVNVYSDDIKGNWKGRIKRISDQIDASTQNVIVFIGISGPNLREGMYLRGKVNTSTVDQAVEIPRKLLVDQQSVYEVQDGALKLREVKVIRITGNRAVIQGVPDGTQLLKEEYSGIYEGMKVNIRTDNSPAAQLTSGGGSTIEQ
ncbi:MAG: HlyD family efflux transporter periplasmic adaptor subunit [Bacteroidota bacterium]